VLGGAQLAGQELHPGQQVSGLGQGRAPVVHLKIDIFKKG
jgi:hypothetical protein